MDPFIVKVLSACLLWTISVCFGVLFPYLLWKISPGKTKHNFEESDQDSDQSTNESENLILNGRNTSNQTRVPPSRWKRIAAWMRVKFADGNFSSSVNCLCGGVFLGVSLLDLFPQSRLAVTAVLDQSKTVTTYPVAEFMVSLGLLLVMIIENLVTEFTHKFAGGNQRKTSNISEHSTGIREDRSYTGYDDASEPGMNVSSYRMYVLVVTLSLHSIFEGLAIGLQKELSTLVQLLIAICVHKAVLSFGIGLPLFETLGLVGKIHTAFICSIIFCTASPLGCVVGAFVSTDKFNSSQGAVIASAVLQCLATGTFLYVTFVEVIPREFSHHSKQHSKRSSPERGSVDLDRHESELPDQGGGFVEVSVTNSRRLSSLKMKSQKRQSQIIKLLAFLLGFAIASGLQFL